MKVRTRLAIAAVLLVGVGLAAVPAGAATSAQNKYLSTLHRVAPATKNFSNAKMVALAKGGICPVLGFAGVSVALESLEQSKNNAGQQDGYGFPKSQAPKILTTAVTYYCPKHKKELAALKTGGSKASAAPVATTQPPPPTTTAPTAPRLTQQQQSAVASAKQYLALEGFSQQGLIDQLDSPDGGQYSVNDATVAVDSLNENWNAEAVQSAKSYLQLEPMSCQALIDQLDSPDGAQFTQAQATYGAQQAGDCG
jgi:hypothetical protein